MTFQTATAARLASLATLVLVFPAPASAGIDPASYHHVDVNHDFVPDGKARKRASSRARRARRLSPRVRHHQGCSTP